jgi:hypothetical protein
MTERQKPVPKWILLVSGLFALLEIMVSLSLVLSPQDMLETVDFNAKGAYFLVYMWSARQFALGVIFAYAAVKRSIPMLTVTYIFFLVMFAGDLLVGIVQKENSLIIAALVMGTVSSVMLFALNKRTGQPTK